MATKKKAGKKKSAKKKAGKKQGASVSVLQFDPRIHGDPPPIWIRQLDVIRQKQLNAWVNAIVKKIGR